MNFDVMRVVNQDVVKFILVIPDQEYMRARFTPFDRMVLADCDSKDATIADKLLGFELIARRIEESVDVGRQPDDERDDREHSDNEPDGSTDVGHG